MNEVDRRIRHALVLVRDRLVQAGIESPAAEARTIVEDCAEATSSLYLLSSLPDDFEQRIEEVLVRRERREPLQRILGWVAFRRVRLLTAPGVFIPRPETELIIDIVAQAHPQPGRVIDLCTGSGAIACAFLDEFAGVQVTAVEREPAALDLARQNLQRAGSPDRWSLISGDVTESHWVKGHGTWDVVVSNPPYIPAGAVPRDPEVMDYDPHEALFGGGEDGGDVPRAVIARAMELLAPAGVFVMEHADVQGSMMREMAAEHPTLQDISTVKDLAGRDRFLVARCAPDA